jgi:broad specificity phosphatase PhoE
LNPLTVEAPVKLPIVAGSLLLVLMCAGEALAQRAIVLVRHAEKLDSSDDPPLSPAGRARADALADLLRAGNVTAIVTSEFRRTQATAAPLAKALKITPQTIKASDVEALVTHLRGAGPDAVVLVVGHSNTVPTILTRLGWTGSVTLQDSDYDNVFVLTPRGTSEPSVLRLKYGRKTS